MGVEEDRPRGPPDPQNIPTGELGVRAVANDRFELAIDRRSVVELTVPLHQLGESLLICHDTHGLFLSLWCTNHPCSQDPDRLNFQLHYIVRLQVAIHFQSASPSDRS